MRTSDFIPDTGVFLADYGLVRYTQTATRILLTAKKCEIPICQCRKRLVLDHCHRHGWIRGVLCQSCNTKMFEYDRDASHEGEYKQHWLNCPDCANGTPEYDYPDKDRLTRKRRRCPGCNAMVGNGGLPDKCWRGECRAWTHRRFRDRCSNCGRGIFAECVIDHDKQKGKKKRCKPPSGKQLCENCSEEGVIS